MPSEIEKTSLSKARLETAENRTPLKPQREIKKPFTFEDEI